MYFNITKGYGGHPAILWQAVAQFVHTPSDSQHGYFPLVIIRDRDTLWKYARQLITGENYQMGAPYEQVAEPLPEASSFKVEMPFMPYSSIVAPLTSSITWSNVSYSQHTEENYLTRTRIVRRLYNDGRVTETVERI